MVKSLWIKFLVLLLGVIVISLSAALLLRELMLGDFRQFLEGEQEDRAYWITADLEGSYESRGRWEMDRVRRDVVWALMLGFETRLLDGRGAIIIDTKQAVASLSPLVKRRLEAITDLRFEGTEGEFHPYPLFLGGKEIGTLELRALAPPRENVFVKRSNDFLLAALGLLGGLAVVLSVVFSGKLTRPLKRIAAATTAISEGNLARRVDVAGKDELGRLAEAFNRMAQTLETQESLRKKMIANVAHELRTPLTAMQGELEGMMDGLIPSDKEQLQSLSEEAGRLKKLIEGMDELTRAQASGLMLMKQDIRVRPFLTNILDRVWRTALEKQAFIALQCEENVVARADPDRLSQIVINLVDNALKAVCRGGRVDVAACRREKEFVLEVRDTGKGIRQEDLAFIFERFYKASNGGLGIGLAIVRELVHAHGGRIEVESEEGRGSRFIVRLPL